MVQLVQVGDSVEVDAVPNTDGGKYEWRCLRVKVAEAPQRAAAAHKLRSNPSFLPRVTLAPSAWFLVFVLPASSA